jgi:hypothetical protein
MKTNLLPTSILAVVVATVAFGQSSNTDGSQRDVRSIHWLPHQPFGLGG